jgi:hypothetical protein
MLKKPSTFVLGSRKSSTYRRGYVSGFLLPAALLGRLFEHLVTALLISLTVLGVVVLDFSFSSAQTGALVKDPAILLKKYLELDNKGARLNSLTWESQKPYVGWKEEPVWGQLVVVNGYEVIEDLRQWDVKNNLDVVIPVEYKVLGSLYLERAVFLSEPHVDRIGFRVKAIDGLWRVVEPMIPPHVGQKRIINYVKQAIVEETDRSRLAALTALRDELRAVGNVRQSVTPGSPPAASSAAPP